MGESQVVESEVGCVGIWDEEGKERGEREGEGDAGDGEVGKS